VHEGEPTLGLLGQHPRLHERVERQRHLRLGEAGEVPNDVERVEADPMKGADDLPHLERVGSE
jgi:hypothetical protein